MTREEAIRILASSCISGSKQTEALETLIPELAESEDERTRKQLIDAIKIGRSNSGISFTEEAASRYIAYLEKQKEQKPSINIDQLKSLMLQYLQEAANEKDDLDIEADTDKWARKILGYDFEQKPVDLSDMMVHKEPYIAPVPTPMVADEQKPAEWSEEDEEMLEYIIGDVNDAKQLYTTKEAKDMADKEIAFLKSLRPSWKPSEEELGRKHLEGYCMGREDTLREMKDFIESHFNCENAKKGTPIVYNTQSGTSTLKAEG